MSGQEGPEHPRPEDSEHWAPPPWPPPSPTPEQLSPPPAVSPPPGVGPAPYWAPPPPLNPYATTAVTVEPATQRSLRRETWVVMTAFLLPSVMTAVILFVQHVNGAGNITRFPVYLPRNPVGNLVVGILAYFPVAATVPLALFLLARTGQGRCELGLHLPSFRKDVWPAFGLILASFAAEFVLAIPLAPILARNDKLANQTPIGHVPHYYLIFGIAMSAITAIAEEVLVNGYLLTRLEQLGWAPNTALVFSLCLRTSYHVYYGLGFVLTIPLGYFVTRSFQKHRRLNRPIVTHFLFDAILFTIAILTS